jgi:TolA-binding protein
MPARVIPVIAAIILLVFATAATPAQDREIQRLQADVVFLQGLVKDLQTSIKEQQRATDNKIQNLQSLLERTVDRMNLMGSELQTNLQGSIQTGVQGITQANQTNADRFARLLDEFKAQNDKNNRDLAASFQAMNTDIAKLNDRIVPAISTEIGNRTNALGEKLSRDMTEIKLQIDAQGKQITNLADAMKVVPLPKPEEMFRTAYVDYSAGLYDIAVEQFDKIISTYPNQPLALRAELFKGDAFFAQDKWEQAVQTYESLLTKGADPITKRAALYKMALSLELLKKTKEALAVFTQITKEFPETTESTNSGEKITKLSKPATPPRGTAATPRGGN